MKEYTLTFTAEELDLIMFMLEVCCGSNQIIADDPKNPLDGLHFVKRTKEEREIAKKIIQKIETGIETERL